MRGYQVYQEMWVAVGKELSCVRETENHRDSFSVVIYSKVGCNRQSVTHQLEREDHKDRVGYS